MLEEDLIQYYQFLAEKGDVQAQVCTYTSQGMSSCIVHFNLRGASTHICKYHFHCSEQLLAHLQSIKKKQQTKSLTVSRDSIWVLLGSDPGTDSAPVPQLKITA